MARRTRATITLGSVGGPQLRRDLEALRIGAGRELVQIQRDAARQIAPVVERLAPVGPGPQGDRDRTPHFKDTIRPRLATVVSSHPAAGLLEFGGTIAPRGYRIRFRAARPGFRAALAEAARVERIAQRRIDGLIARVSRG